MERCGRSHDLITNDESLVEEKVCMSVSDPLLKIKRNERLCASAGAGHTNSLCVCVDLSGGCVVMCVCMEWCRAWAEVAVVVVEARQHTNTRGNTSE